ncbi:hypothetical protein [Effusibacillus lacus]|uniref:Type 4 fimbrial biogenesis protein PilX N-terminal domain-containing protein n=1 Tax=Effusibacillus lacus TaxID=1348429 RepID=A0A292YHP0_9BACL|nr:hypothetical protein [Effusibacillus lacus]TCS74625.1 hypothetical protein EDD64_11273 [Effusibacillus lacus]GAX88496.1 hypothetical protein EFBL_0105 [Effusibacillus lacus]
MPHTRQSRESGYTLVLVLMVSLILMTLLAAVSTRVVSEAKSTESQGARKQAYYLAEEGAELVLSKLHQTAETSGYPDNQAELNSLLSSLNLPISVAEPAGTIDITNARFLSNGTVEFTAVGTIPASNKVQQIVVTVDMFTLPAVFQYSMASEGDVDFKGNPNVTMIGNIYLGGTTNLKNGFKIENGRIELGKDSNLNEKDLDDYPVTKRDSNLSFPSYTQLKSTLQGRSDAAEIQTQSISLSTLLTTNKDVFLLNGEKWEYDNKKDKWELKSNEVTLKLDTWTDKKLFIATTGDLTIEVDEDFDDKQFRIFFYAPNGTLKIDKKNVLKLKGGISGSTVEINGGKGNSNVVIEFDRDLFSEIGIEDMPGISTPNPEVISRRIR